RPAIRATNTRVAVLTNGSLVGVRFLRTDRHGVRAAVKRKTSRCYHAVTGGILNGYDRSISRTASPSLQSGRARLEPALSREGQGLAGRPGVSRHRGRGGSA